MPFRFPDARILIFAKAPVPGQVKTRLIPALGAEGAAAVQSRLIERTVTRLAQAALAPIQLWCAPDGAHSLFRKLVDPALWERLAAATTAADSSTAGRGCKPLPQAAVHASPVDLYIQQGDGLGERMAFAAHSALAEARWVVLVGCDIPELDGDYLAQALEWLVQPGPSRVDFGARPSGRESGALGRCAASNKRAVLGPAEDGGYVLLGLSGFAPELFAAMPWGGPAVAEITRERLRRLGWEWAELEPLWDLDRPEDLERWSHRE